MRRKSNRFLVIFIIKLVFGKDTEPELPLCPTNVQYFPQNLPMHCRMPQNANYPSQSEQSPNPTPPPFLPPFYQNPSPGKEPPIPFPVPPGVPGPFPMPPGFPGPIPMAPGVAGPMPMPPGVPGPMPISMPMMPMPAAGPANKLPVIVMPFYSPDPAYKKGSPPRRHPNRRPPKRNVEVHNRRPYYSNADRSSDTDTDYDTDASSDADTSSEGHGWWKSSRGFKRSGRRLNKHHKSRRRKHNKKELLTPILQYVSRDGYVIFEKKISKGEAKQWLHGNRNNDKRNEANSPVNEAEDMESENTKKNMVDDNEAKIDNTSKEDDAEITTQKAIKHHKRKPVVAKNLK